MRDKFLTLLKRQPFFILLSILVSMNNVNAQNFFKGKVIFDKDPRPASAVSVSLIHTKAGKTTDEYGNFNFSIPGDSKNDTVIISSVGYESISVPLSQAISKKEFKLKERSTDLQTVVVQFNKEAVIGDKQEHSASFRSWNARKAGEIGRIFQIAHSEYKVNKVRFKVDNSYKTCQVLLHIRKVANGYPTTELLQDSITLPVGLVSLKDEAPEFDLNKYNIVLKEKEIYVGLEILSCDTIENKVFLETCSLSLASLFSLNTHSS